MKRWLIICGVLLGVALLATVAVFLYIQSLDGPILAFGM